MIQHVGAGLCAMVFAIVAAASFTQRLNSFQDADDSNEGLCTGLTQIREVVDRQNARVVDFDANLARDAGLVVDLLEGQDGGRTLAVHGEVGCK